jgi:hypothetical protein
MRIDSEPGFGTSGAKACVATIRELPATEVVITIRPGSQTIELVNFPAGAEKGQVFEGL